METDSRLVPLGTDIWLVEGPTIDFYKIPFPTRMVVIRLPDGDLFLHSPIAFDQDLADEISTLGRIRHLVSPNWIHYAYIADWAAACPDTVAWSSPGVRERAKSRGLEISFDRDLGDDAPEEWSQSISQIIVHGSKVHTEVVFHHHASKVLILTDLIENMPAIILPLWVRPLAWMAGILAPKGKMPLDIWYTFSGNRDKLQRALGQMLAWDPKIVVLAHGDILRQNVPQRLREGFRNLEPLAKEE